jgi:glycosyltransferase 2 family protein
VNNKLRILVSVSLVGWLAWRTDWEQIRQAGANLQIGYWLAALALYLGIQVISGFRWQLLAKPLGFEASIWQFTRFYFIGMFFNLFLPTSVGGDVVRAWYLGDGSAASAFLSVLVDRLSGLVVLLALACAALALCPIALPGWITASVLCAAGVGLACIILAPVLLRRTSRFSKARRLAERSLIYADRPRLMIATTILSLFIQAGNVALVWLVGQSLRLPVPASYFWIMVPMVTLLTMLPVSLNGMGVREGGTILFLTPLGIAHGPALSLAILWFAVFTVASLVGGVLYLFHRYPKAEVFPDVELEQRAAA